MIASGTPTRARRTLASTLAALVLALLALMVSASPAAAHDELVSTDPAAGSTVDALPAHLTLGYSAELLSQGSGTVVEVTDAAGTSLTDGQPMVDGAVVVQPLAGDAEGTVSVVWRVVSSDGHPISGEFSFEVAAAAPAETPTAEPAATPSETAESTPEPTMTTLVVDEDTDEPASPLPWVIGAIVLVAVIVLVVWLLGARARQQKQLARDRTAGRTGRDER